MFQWKVLVPCTHSWELWSSLAGGQAVRVCCWAVWVRESEEKRPGARGRRLPYGRSEMEEVGHHRCASCRVSSSLDAVS